LAVTLFWMLGFGLMFGQSSGGLIGTSDFFIGLDNHWEVVFFVFQSVFVGTAATIDSGAVAGRTRFASYLVLSALVSALIYPIFGHWAWGSLLSGGEPGWLEGLGFKDFAGSTVVHSIGGWVALAGVVIIGPRRGKFDKNGKPRRIQPHNMTLAYLGTFILFFGWFGFNCGSTLAASPQIADIAINTMLAACFGCVSSSALSWLRSPFRRPEGEMIANGILAGLVGITAGRAPLWIPSGPCG
jgi:Amt family ammonium transporter